MVKIKTDSRWDKEEAGDYRTYKSMNQTIS